MFSNDLILNKQRLLTPGPTPLPETVRLALAQDMIHHRKPVFKGLMEKVQNKLKILFGTTQPVLPLASSGTGAMTAAVYNLFAPGEKVLVIVGGKFGQRWEEIAKTRQLNVIPLIAREGEAIQPKEIAEYFHKDPAIKGVLVQMCETSTGVMHPVEEIAKIVANTSALLVVDGISGVGIAPCPMDSWAIDCLLTGSQKGLMLPPGLALIALSEKAWKKTESVPQDSYYFNLPAEKNSVLKNQTNFTTPVNLINGLNASLDFILENGISAIYKKQWALTMLTRTGATALGFKLFAQENFAWGITAICPPQNLNADLLLKIAWENFGVIMAGGHDDLKGKIIRIGHMGWVDWADCMAALQSLACVIISQGVQPMNQGFASEAMLAYTNALANWKDRVN